MSRETRLLDSVRQLMHVMLVSERTAPEHQHVIRFNALDFHLLGLLREQGSLRASDAAEQIGIAPTTASSVIARLKSRGLIERTQSKTDRRAYDIALSDKGLEIAQTIHAQDIQNMGVFLSALTASEQDMLIALMGKVATHVETLQKTEG
ncbi:MarR family winged helix-turn-helix transcriptional regulator [Sulfitobacter aestuariivivens]|uniref:MarR family transcriptional regulator n=1 Tax=Sulfitobacter aestuariivivens TaxID=2766981 RepID=A0A927HDL1_9RHOB|nr:MarR family transcriptional regulator [Sulfitobacter aestuariivivens]MBD3663832.1 MarR family transcriptional regulator [Sulfitobacter aestuariivivens]